MNDHQHESYEVYGVDSARQDAREALTLAGGLREDLATAEDRIRELQGQLRELGTGLRRDTYRESLDTDSQAEALEDRVAAMEEVVAASWPRRILVRARLGRQLRASVRNFPGETWAARRAEAASADWLDSQ